MFTPPASVQRAILGVLAFCLVASAVYIINAYRNRAADRLHAEKRHRPLAAQTVTVLVAAGLMLALLAGDFALAAALSPTFVLRDDRFALKLAYPVGLNDTSIVDVLVIAVGFVIRFGAGAVLVEVSLSAWIMISSALLALFLAVAKRRDDVVRALDAGTAQPRGLLLGGRYSGEGQSAVRPRACLTLDVARVPDPRIQLHRKHPPPSPARPRRATSRQLRSMLCTAAPGNTRPLERDSFSPPFTRTGP